MPMSMPPPAYDSRPDLGTNLTPYLQLSHRLSLTWLAYPILSILFIAFRLILSGDAAQTAVGNAKGDLLVACNAAQQAASSGASAPRYMALASNELIVKSTNVALDATRQALVLALTVMEAIINFVIDIYRSTFLCFLELIVRGALSLLISATQEVSDLLHNTASGLRTTIQNDVSGINSAIKSIVDKVNSVNPFGNISAPQFDVPDLSALENVTIPSDFTNALTSLNASLPSPQQLKSELEDIIDTPFELVKKEINDTFLGITFNSSVLPVPELASVSFCDQMDTSIVDDLGEALSKMVKIGIIILVITAIVLIAGNCFWEWWKWRSLQSHLQYTREAWATDPAVVHVGPTAQPSVDLSNHNLLMLAASTEHPLITRIANNVSNFLRLSPSKNINLRWFMHYIFHPPALACFIIGAFGLLSCQIQLWALAPLEARFQQQALASAQDFSTTISTAMNSSMYNQSALYAGSVNAQIDTIQTTINNGLFGWVNGTTTTLNNTIATFYSDVQNIVNTIFGNTPLAQPAQEFIQCLIGTKVDAIENVLTFLNENLQVNVTRVNETVLVLSPAHVDELAQPIARAAVGGSDGSSDSGLVGRLVNTYADSLRKERIMFGIFLGLWLVVVLMGMAIIVYHSYLYPAVERRRFRQFQQSHRSGFESVITPFKEGAPATHDKPVEQLDVPKVELRSFTPISQLGHADPNKGLAARFQTIMGKSFDSFFDRDAEPATHPTPPPSRLGAIGRRFGRSSPTDSEKTVPEREEGSTSWWSRLRPRHRRTDSDDSTASRRARRPNLTISPEIAESARNSRVLPIIERTSPTDEGGSMHRAPPPDVSCSAWSLSPTSAPVVQPWLAPPVAQTQPIPPMDLDPGARRKPSVPDDISSSLSDVSPLGAAASAPQQEEVPLALHNAFPAPPPLPRYLLPPGIPRPGGASLPRPRLNDPFSDEAARSLRISGRYPVLPSPAGHNPFADAAAPRAF